MRHNLAPAQLSQHPPRCVMGSKVSSEPGADLLPFVAFDQFMIMFLAIFAHIFCQFSTLYRG